MIDERPPQPPRRIGRIEAVARTPIMGFPRGRLDPHHARRRGIPCRYPLLLALFRKRPRAATRARHQADRGHQYGGRQRQAGAEEAAGAGESTGEDGQEVKGRMGVANGNEATCATRYSSLRHPIGPADHRIALRRHDAARDQIFQMRQHGIAGGRRSAAGSRPI